MAFPKRETAIVGVYLTEQAPKIERSSASLEIEAVKGALEDAGLKPSDVDGIAVSGQTMGVDDRGDKSMYWAEQFGGKPLTSYTVTPHGSAAITKAAAAIGAGLCETVVLVHGKSGYNINPSNAAPPTKAPRTGDFQPAVWGIYPTPWYALWAQAYLHEFGATSEQLAEIGVSHRYHATLNPKSIMGKRGAITVEDVVNSRMIASPLHLLDCCIDNDGGYALVITTAERAKSLKKKPVYILGGGEATYINVYIDIDDPWFKPGGQAVKRASDMAFAHAGVSRDDIDVAGLYDCFSITVVRDLEEAGFCKLGEGASFIQGGTIRLGGKLPVNPHGGLMSCSHNGVPGGMHTIEVVKQLRGNEVEPERQVKDAKIGFTLSQGMAVHGGAGALVVAVD